MVERVVDTASTKVSIFCFSSSTCCCKRRICSAEESPDPVELPEVSLETSSPLELASLLALPELSSALDSLPEELDVSLEGSLLLISPESVELLELELLLEREERLLPPPPPPEEVVAAAVTVLGEEVAAESTLEISEQFDTSSQDFSAKE